MLIKTTLIAAIAAIGLTGAAMAGGSKAPTILDDQALDNITAGARLQLELGQSPTQSPVDVGADLQTLNEALEVAETRTRNNNITFRGDCFEYPCDIEIYSTAGDSVIYFKSDQP